MDTPTVSLLGTTALLFEAPGDMSLAVACLAPTAVSTALVTPAAGPLPSSGPAAAVAAPMAVYTDTTCGFSPINRRACSANARVSASLLPGGSVRSMIVEQMRS